MPGGKVRLYANALPDVVQAQLRDGEIALAIDQQIMDATISDDGLSLVAPVPDPADLMRMVRCERDLRLAATDWVVARAAERGEPVPEAWAAYRQALRDLPDAQPDATPETVIWPPSP